MAAIAAIAVSVVLAVLGSYCCLGTHGGTFTCIGYVCMFQPTRPYGLGLGRGVL